MTIFADASFCPNTGAGGWGAWIKADGPSIVVGGPLKGRVPGNNTAELYALARAVMEAGARRLFEVADVVMLQSDSLYALGHLMNIGGQDRPAPDGARAAPLEAPPTHYEGVALERIKSLIGERPLLVRHVKGHKSGGGRQWVNRECDRLARDAMRMRRAELAAEAPARAN